MPSHLQALVHLYIRAGTDFVEIPGGDTGFDIDIVRPALVNARRVGFQRDVDIPDRGKLLEIDDAGLRNFILDIVDVAKSRGLTVTAEGVEDSASWYRLAGLGVDMAQGFLIARPLLAVAVPVWLRRWSKRQSFA